MSESGDYNPGPWSGQDFSSRRKTYDQHVGRSYGEATSAGKRNSDLLEQKLKTNSPSPMIIACDVTGSMGDWPATMFSKLPYLNTEGQEYLGKDMEIAFLAVGDAYCDKYPLQARPFTKGKELEKRLKELVIEGGGGGQLKESYDLAALYCLKNVEMPKAKRPLLIFIGDEGLYDFVNADQAKEYVNTKQEKRTSMANLFDDLKKKYSVYLIRKPYETSSSDGMSSTDKQIYAQWEKLLGSERISILPNANRVVDVIFGILANETSRVDYFNEELAERQKPEQVLEVREALDSIHGKGKSTKYKKSENTTPTSLNGTKGKSLL